MAVKTFDQLIDFTRTSAGTYIDSAGILRSTLASQNLWTFTQEFDNGAWTKSQTAITTNQTRAPDGTMTADKLVATATSGYHALIRAAAPTTFTTGIRYCVSYYVKAAEYSKIIISDINSGSFACTFDLLTGTAGTPGGGFSNIVASITAEANGFYRCSLSFTATTTGARSTTVVGYPDTGATLNSYGAQYTGDGVSGIFVWGAQLELIPDANLVTGSEILSNGTFASDTVWTKGSGWTISGGVASHGVGTDNSDLSQTIGSVVVGQQYVAQISITSSTAPVSARIIIGNIGVDLPEISETGTNTYTVRLIPTTTGDGSIRIRAVAGTSTYSVDNVSLKAVTGSVGMPTTYTRNFGGTFPARLNYDPVTLSPLGLLVEEQRTNLILRSEQFDNASWTKDNSTVTANATTSPDGTVDADKLVEDATTNAHSVIQVAGTAASTAYTISVYAKAAERTRIGLWNTVTANALSYFDLAAGTVVSTTNSTATITPAGNGWYRCTMTFTTAVGQPSINARVILVSSGTTANYAGDGTSGVFIWGAQLEAGAFATSYIPTVASQVTRIADTPSITGANFTQWFNTVAGTIVVEADGALITSGTSSIVVGYNSASTHSFVYFAAGNARTFNGSSALATPNSGVNNVSQRAAMAYSADGRAITLNGGTVVSDAIAYGTATGLYIGKPGNGATQMINGHIQRITYYPVRLTNATLQALTA